MPEVETLKQVIERALHVWHIHSAPEASIEEAAENVEYNVKEWERKQHENITTLLEQAIGVENRGMDRYTIHITDQEKFVEVFNLLGLFISIALTEPSGLRVYTDSIRKE